ncbi:hypothetical protein ACIBCT_21380 [Streptosporangium sp. NPDC050855]|uniref:hypothetical protein n=1 Tax=Streptosporangium sp. NPDC050855 TaxID=3366194 RepID=UPI003797C156
MGDWTARAEVLADTSGLGVEAAAIVGRCRATGLDSQSFRRVISATLILGAHPMAAGGDPWGNDRELVCAILDLLDDVAARWDAYIKLRTVAANRRAVARTRAVNADADDVKARWRRIAVDCTTALDILGELRPRLSAAALRLSAAPHQLGDTYAAVYALIAQGRTMPHNGRWITGEEITS